LLYERAPMIEQDRRRNRLGGTGVFDFPSIPRLMLDTTSGDITTSNDSTIDLFGASFPTPCVVQETDENAEKTRRYPKKNSPNMLRRLLNIVRLHIAPVHLDAAM